MINNSADLGVKNESMSRSKGVVGATSLSLGTAVGTTTVMNTKSIELQQAPAGIRSRQQTAIMTGSIETGTKSIGQRGGNTVNDGVISK